MKNFELNKKKYISIDAIAEESTLKKQFLKFRNRLDILGKAKDLTDEQLKGMVEMNEGVYRLSKQEFLKDYDTKELYKSWHYHTRIASWQSYMKKYNINPNDLILKII